MAGGRPTVMTEDVIRKLEDAFLMGCTDTEACLYASIVPSTLYKYQESNPEFTERKETLKQNPFMQARRVTLDALRDDDRGMAIKVLDRKEGSKLAVTGADGGPIEVREVERTIIDPANTDS